MYTTVLTIVGTAAKVLILMDDNNALDNKLLDKLRWLSMAIRAQEDIPADAIGVLEFKDVNAFGEWFTNLLDAERELVPTERKNDFLHAVISITISEWDIVKDLLKFKK